MFKSFVACLFVVSCAFVAVLGGAEGKVFTVDHFDPKKLAEKGKLPKSIGEMIKSTTPKSKLNDDLLNVKKEKETNVIQEKLAAVITQALQSLEKDENVVDSLHVVHVAEGLANEDGLHILEKVFKEKGAFYQQPATIFWLIWGSMIGIGVLAAFQGILTAKKFA